MSIKSKNHTLFLSILLSLALVQAHDVNLGRRHESLNRIIKKRSPHPANDAAFGIINAALGLSPTTTDSAVPSPSSSALSVAVSVPVLSAASASAVASSAPPLSSASASAVSSASLVASVSASASASASSLAVSSASSTSISSVVSTTKTTAAAPQTTANAATQAAQQPTAVVVDQVTTAHRSTVTQTASVTATAASNGPAVPVTQTALAATKSTVTTVLIAIAASVGGIVILWTIFRKWKLGHSAKFDERMAPIDWQPTNDEGIVPGHRTLSRNASVASGNYNDNLDHDFTAMPTNNHLAPVGGYADLARSSSPQPQMADMGRGGVTRGPSTNRGLPAEAYDYNGDPVRF